jgi:prepilin-type N-terminal cleavage/methylation domain-containing protein
MTMHGACRPRPRPRGTTLIELLIVIVLIGILGVYASTVFSNSYTTARMVDSSKSSADQLRYAMERLSRELREIKFVDTATGYSISSTLAASASNLVFVRTISGTDVTVTINKSGSNLTLGYSSPAVTSNIAQQVTGFTMDFYTINTTTGVVSATASKSNLRFVVLTLTATDALSGQAITERTRVTLRNNGSF